MFTPVQAVLGVALIGNALFATWLWRSAEPNPHYGIWFLITLAFLPVFALVSLIYVPVTLIRRHGVA